MATRPQLRSKRQRLTTRWRRLSCASPSDAEAGDSEIAASSVRHDSTVTLPMAPSQEEHSAPQRNPHETIADNAENTSTTERFGLFPIEPENARTSADIVAVHGLEGHYQMTWTWRPAKSNVKKPCNWLQHLLPQEFPHARIMSFGYNSAVVHSKSVGDISTFAEQLLQVLSRERGSEQQKHRPIVFVCHSLGGIVVKKMLNLANERRRSRDFDAALLQSLKGILFMGTPHRGSNMADLGSIGAKVLQAASLGRSTNTELIKQLKQGTRVLQEISSSFTSIATDFYIWTFIESDRMDGLSEPIVTEDSARLNIPNEQFCPLNGNHRTMCKFDGRNENYKMVAHAIGGLIGAHFELIVVHPSQDLHNEAGEIDHFNSEGVVWFFESPEFAHWKCHSSEALHLLGKPGSGKTVITRCLWNHLKRNCTYASCQDIAIYFNRHMNQVPESRTAHILHTLIVQLLKSDRERLEAVAQHFPLQELSSLPFTPSSHLLNQLWKFLSASLVAIPGRQVIIIIDALDEIPNDEITESRRTFLRNLLQLRADASNKGVDFKIFVTSRPYDDIKTELSTVPCIEEGKERQECLRSLQFDGFSGRRDRVEKAHPESGQWLTSDDAYKNWESRAQSSLLLIRGKPGSGKSTLAKLILESMSSYAPTQSSAGKVARSMKTDVLIADFFYSFRGGIKETNHTLMLQSLLYQLLSQDQRLFPLFQEVYRAKRADPEFEWQKEDLDKIFAALPSLKSKQKIYIFLDAMDESAEQGRPEVLRILQKLCAAKSNCVFKCLIASRPLPDGQIDDSECYRIILQDKNRDDIEKLITSGLRNISKMAGGGAIDFKLAYEHMINNAHGVFLWVSLVLKELEKAAASGTSQEEAEGCLRNLPLDLEEMYELIIQRLKLQPQSMIDQGAKMLSWVTFAERPLSMEEFHDAVVVPSHPKLFSPHPGFLERAKIYGFEKRLQVCCGPLLEVRQSVVQLLHLTVREHLLREDRRAKPFDTDEYRGDTEIASVCVRYLSLLSLPPGTEKVATWSSINYDEFARWLAGYSLLGYVVRFLPRHLKPLASDSSVFDELSMFIKEFQKHDPSFCLFENWARPLGRPETTFLQPSMNPRQFRAKCLIAAVRNSHTGVAGSVLDLHTDINQIDEESGTTALHVAVDNGSKPMVAFLLSRDADVESKNKENWTPLSRAAELGRTDIIKLLLEAGGYVNAQGGQYGNALQAASFRGHERVVEMLLEAGANVNAHGGEHGNALSAASFRGHESVVEMLLQQGAEVNFEIKEPSPP